MSLEANLERNNQLLAEHNALLAQLLAKMNSEPPAPISSIADPEPEASVAAPEPEVQSPAPVSEIPLHEREGPFYFWHPGKDRVAMIQHHSQMQRMLDLGCVEISRAEYGQRWIKEQAETRTQKAPVAPTPEEPAAAQPAPTPHENSPQRDIETLDKHTVVALAVLYPEITPEALTDAHAEAADALRLQHQSTPQSAQCDELFMALAGVKPAINIPRSKLLEIAQTILKYWDILPGIEDRREYGYQLLGSHPDKRHHAKPPEVKSKKSAKGKTKATDASELPAEGPDGAPHGSRSPDDIPASGPPDTPDKGGTADIAALREKGRLILVNRLENADREAIVRTLTRCGVESISKSPDEKVPAVVAALEQLADELGG